jgi:hypothetical protein
MEVGALEGIVLADLETLRARYVVPAQTQYWEHHAFDPHGDEDMELDFHFPIPDDPLWGLADDNDLEEQTNQPSGEWGRKVKLGALEGMFRERMKPFMPMMSVQGQKIMGRILRCGEELTKAGRLFRCGSPLCPGCGHRQKQRIARNLSRNVKWVQQHAQHSVYFVSINYESCEVSQVKETMKRFRKAISNTFQRKLIHCFVLGEYELAGEEDPDRDGDQIGVISGGAEQETPLGSPITTRPMVKVHAHFALVPYRGQTVDEVASILRQAFTKARAVRVQVVEDLVIRGRLRDGIDRVMEYSVDKSHSVKGFKRQYKSEANPRGTDPSHQAAVFDGYSIMMGGQNRRLKLVFRLPKDAANDLFKTKP